MHPRNFGILQDSRDIMYFANAYGVTEYDGVSWRSINMPNGTSGLSLAMDQRKTIFVGSYNELGYLTTDTSGTTVYKSLVHLIPPKEEQVANVYNVSAYLDGVVFQTAQALYLYRHGKFKVIPHATKLAEFTYLQKIGEDVYVNEVTKGLEILRNQSLELVPGGELLKNMYVKELLPLMGDSLLVLEKNGLFVFDHQKVTPLNARTNEILKKQKLTHALYLQNGNIAVTTYSAGLYIISKNGEIIKHINQDSGLRSNSIHDAYTDKTGGLWLAQDNGITYLEINSPFSYITDVNGIQGMGYAATIFNHKLYLGTSQGLYFSEMGKDQFRKVNNISGQIWQLAVIDNTLICCQQEHAYQVDANHAREIVSNMDWTGNWKMISLLNKPGFALKGTYEGFQLYQKTGGQWHFVRKLAGFDESSRVFVQDKDGVIWMCHGNQGMYRITLADDLSKIETAVNYSVKKGFAPDYFHEVALINDQIIFSSTSGPYVLEPIHGNMIKHVGMESVLGKGLYLNKLIQYPDKNIWCFTGNDVYVYRYNKATGKQVRDNGHALKKVSGELVGSFEIVYPLTTNRSIIGSQDGFIIYDLNASAGKVKDKFKVEIRKIELNYNKDTILFGGTQLKTKQINEWPYTFNKLRFSYAAFFYENTKDTKYQYELTAANETATEWSTWTGNTQVDLANLYEGHYVFHVRAKNIYGEISNEANYAFTILPPWYRSVWAYLFYILLFCFAGFNVYKFVKQRFELQKQKLEDEKQKELLLLEQKHITERLQNEKELIALRNNKLEAEVVLKNNELASLATTVTLKTEFLSHLKDKLETINKDSSQANGLVFKEVIKTIDQDLDFDDNWSRFQLHFDELHHNFLHRLREAYPKLNPSWLLLCAYIRMNKSNKEIASHMNISVAGVEKRKYRLREKLELDNDEKLADFIGRF